MTLMENAVTRIQSCSANYAKDLDAMDDALVMESAGGSARKPVDFTFEVALINYRLAAMIKGETPPAEPEGDADWWVAPEELRGKEAIKNYLTGSCQAMINAITGLSDEEAKREVKWGENDRPIYSLANFVVMHTMYHDAQLNFIQSLKGDLTVHWS